MFYILKVIISAVLIVLISEVAKRSSILGSILASIPIVSVLAFIWLYIDTGSVEKITKLSYSVFWLVIPSLVLFISLPLFLKYINFYAGLFFSIILTVVAYYLMIMILSKFGVSL